MFEKLSIISNDHEKTRTILTYYLAPLATVTERTRNNKCWQHLDKKKTLCTAGSEANRIDIVEISMEVSQNLKLECHVT